ncbi:hypothetical protein [Nostoc sp. TCL240-02]|uniref:hypothetical protein n=1 Tax=Nostoc sp. TCL240-02 TaxID=2572090 RepID=UPI00157F8A5E|nr:hypothetical protein [Nostoc sp. TCL240-02]QKQ75630.1 hypothetical protein FBB35_22140 [Nostoc sp. TCL240-02]
MPQQDTRQEHLEWAKQRAIAQAEHSTLISALDSIASDLQKHPETRGHSVSELGLMLYMSGRLGTKEQMIRFIQAIS